MKSITYWHPKVYSFLLKLSYGKHYSNRYKAICEYIDSGSSVVDVCCGDCKLYNFLSEKKVDYLGLDFNEYFIKSANKKKIKARVFNINNDEIPNADFVIMQGSLYHFFPIQNQIIEKMLNAASRSLIISEPVKTKAHSKFKLLSFLGTILNNPGDGIRKFRFTLETFQETLAPYQKYIKQLTPAANGIDCIAVLSKFQKD